MNAHIHLNIVGVLLLALAGFNFLALKHFGWRAELQKVSLLTRQVFFVHMIFIVMIVVMFGLASLLAAPLMLEGGTLGALVLGGMAVFWGTRLLIQLFGYDRKLWWGDRPKTVAHVVFTVLWVYFTAVFGIACWQAAA